MRLFTKPAGKPAARDAAPCRRPAIPHGVLRPTAPNRTWHLDLTTIRFLWLNLYIAAVLDGYSRKLLALRVHRMTPTSLMMAALVRRCVRLFGTPRFLVTDHGCQFCGRFGKSMKRLGITLVKGRIRSPQFNGRIERFFKTLKLWQRATLFSWKCDGIQRRLDVYREWYNAERPMWTLEGRTPEERWRGLDPPDGDHVRIHDPPPDIDVTRRGYGDDHRLIVLDLRVSRRLRRVG